MVQLSQKERARPPVVASPQVEEFEPAVAVVALAEPQAVASTLLFDPVKESTAAVASKFHQS